MKALVIAGGRGTRLSVLSEACPKHFLPVLNKPLLFYVLDNLVNFNVRDVVFSLHHRKNFYSRTLNTYKEKLNLSFKDDKAMLGPWFPIIEQVKKENSLLVACAGDVFAQVDYSQILNFHEQHNKPVTLVVTKTYPTPKAMTFKVKNNVLCSCKRVDFSRSNDYINIGIYIVEPDLLNFLPRKMDSFYEDDLFAIFTKHKIASAYVMPEKGFNINTPYNLFCANLYQLQKERLNNEKIDKKQCFDGLVCMGDNATVSKKCMIGPNVIIGDRVVIEEGARIRSSVILADTKIGNNSRCSYSIVGSNLEIDQGVRVDNAVWGSKKENFQIDLSSIDNDIKE